MEITSGMVKELREKTGAGLMDCKAALVSADGDMEKAIDALRTKGLAAAAKKSSRIASEGLVVAHVEDNCGTLVEVNCETDFVAKNEEFASMARDFAAQVNTKAPVDVDEALMIQLNNATLEEMLTEKIAKIGEKLSFRRFERFCVPKGAGLIASYIHMGGKIGVLVALEGVGPENEAVTALAKDIAMQVAAANPTYICRDDVPASVVAHEKMIYKEQAKASGKPDNVLDKIATGKLEKFFGDFCIIEQAFIKDPDKKVGQLLSEAGKAAGKEITIKSFARFQVGEGMEKRSDDLAAEVAKQIERS